MIITRLVIMIGIVENYPRFDVSMQNCCPMGILLKLSRSVILDKTAAAGGKLLPAKLSPRGAPSEVIQQELLATAALRLPDR